MKKIKFNHALFVKSADSNKGCPQLQDDSGAPLPEIAFAGKSNVGKSSLLNHLLRHSKLAKTSSVPGKTRLLNFYTVDRQLALADLPGYGYAKVSKKEQASWGGMIQTYLEKRDSLRMILFLFDIRRTPEDVDIKFMEWIRQEGLAVLLVLTKVDKISRNKRTSTTKNIGRQKLISLINTQLGGDEDG